ncbi:4-hydroxyphenylacetate 3-monooxygenase reductase subunit [Pandoraea cepalis]|uniref:4-hydroxyphenylacetate 3-monooxygenase reductase subunit n=1 Tax=Pandoraea cepalis TaxID=2508294 RepID=A0A5E4VWB7_9BURK|nr:flavin reductase family protein [Pandoraea cepalis]VVE16688.1 4-hydroxyphenylacetate 3-monooxygenase reductase subunit [Pandoraea cepalis]
MTLPPYLPSAATPADFRQGMRRLAGAVTVIAARLADGSRLGIAATAVCSVSAEPAALLACVNQSTSLGRVIAAGLPFTVNVLGAKHEELARAFGGMLNMDQTERFRLGDWCDATNGAPMLADALVSFACHVSRTIVFASHVIVIGEVAQVALHDAAPLPGNLVYHDGSFRRIDSM